MNNKHYFFAYILFSSVSCFFAADVKKQELEHKQWQKEEVIEQFAGHLIAFYGPDNFSSPQSTLYTLEDQKIFYGMVANYPEDFLDGQGYWVDALFKVPENQGWGEIIIGYLQEWPSVRNFMAFHEKPSFLGIRSIRFEEKYKIIKALEDRKAKFDTRKTSNKEFLKILKNS